MWSTPATRRTCSTCATTSSTVACGRGWSSSHARANRAKAVRSRGSIPSSRAACAASARHRAHAGDTKAGTNVTMHTPPLPGSAASTSSGTLRGTSQTARAEECEKITGASLTRSAARIVSAETWERSTSMPSRFISLTTSSPNGDSPPTCGWSVAESAQGTLVLWVRVRYRTPSAYIIRRVPSEQSIEWPPSMPMSEAIFPDANTSSTSSAVRARVPPSQGAQRAVERRAAPQALERGDLPGREHLHHLAGGARQRARVGAPGHHGGDRVDLFQRGRHGVVTLQAAGYEHRPEL